MDSEGQYSPAQVRAAITNSARPSSALMAHSSATGRGVADALGTVNIELGSIKIGDRAADDSVVYAALAIGIATPVALRLIEGGIRR